MCILALGLECHPEWPLVLVHNRDEETDRETDPCGEHADGLIYARDAVAGGTWLGLNRETGAFAALTNVRSRVPRPTGGPSRGGLVVDALKRPADEVAASAAAFSAFHLWHGSAFPGKLQARFTRSWPSPPTSDDSGDGAWRATSEAVGPGEVVARSNEASAGVSWPKTRQLRGAAARTLAELPDAATPEELRDQLAAILMGVLDEKTLDALGGDAEQLAASPLPTWKERVLQRGLLVSRRACLAAPAGEVEWKYGTGNQSVLLSSARRRCVYLFQRTLDGAEQTPGPWSVWEVPWPAEEAPAPKA